MTDSTMNKGELLEACIRLLDELISSGGDDPLPPRYMNDIDDVATALKSLLTERIEEENVPKGYHDENQPTEREGWVSETILQSLLSEFGKASEERYQFLEECRKEANKWKAENDMYGWNFHTGMASGANWADLYYQRVARKLEGMIATAPKQEEPG